MLLVPSESTRATAKTGTKVLSYLLKLIANIFKDQFMLVMAIVAEVEAIEPPLSADEKLKEAQRRFRAQWKDAFSSNILNLLIEAAVLLLPKK